MGVFITSLHVHKIILNKFPNFTVFEKQISELNLFYTSLGDPQVIK